jgi:pyrroline-5-carboxylate reductase
MQNNLKICFIGGGNMAQALIGGLAGKLTAAANIHVVDVNPDTLASLSAQFGVQTSSMLGHEVSAADVLVLAVKPQQMYEVASSLVPYLRGQLVLSIAAGIRAVDLSRWLNGHQAIVRTMPNTPALIGKGVTGMTASSGVTPEQRETANAILQAVGQTVWLEDESQLDAVTAISGSGPADVFYFLESMQKAAVDLGLTAEQGYALALATFTGASALAAQSTESASVLRERVTSKGGTTHAAITSMQAAGVGEAIAAALQAAVKRSQEMGEEFGKV